MYFNFELKMEIINMCACDKQCSERDYDYIPQALMNDRTLHVLFYQRMTTSTYLVIEYISNRFTIHLQSNTCAAAYIPIINK